MLKHTLIALALTTTAASAAPVDWTPYLKGMQHNCDTSKLYTILEPSYNEKTGKVFYPKLPKTLKSSVISSEDGEIKLKNAVAFGQPITNIQFATENLGSGETVVGFSNSNFMSLISQFTLSDGKTTKKTGTNSYWVNEVIEKESGGIAKIIHTHSPKYYDGADSDIIHAFRHQEGYGNIKEAKSTLNPKFFTEQKPIFDKIVKNYNQQLKKTKPNQFIGYTIATYYTHATGWNSTEGVSSLALNFDKDSKSIACSYHVYNGFPQ